MSSKANHLTWQELRSNIRAPSKDAQPQVGKDRALLSSLRGAAESSRTLITLACEHGHTRRKRFVLIVQHYNFMTVWTTVSSYWASPRDDKDRLLH